MTRASYLTNEDVSKHLKTPYLTNQDVELTEVSSFALAPDGVSIYPEQLEQPTMVTGLLVVPIPPFSSMTVSVTVAVHPPPLGE